MNQLVSIGRIMYGAGMLVLGFLCMLSKDFIIGRPPAWPAAFQPGLIFGVVTGAIILICSLGILLNRFAMPAVWIIGSCIILFSFSRHLFTIGDTWPNAFKALALAGGSFIMAASLPPGPGYKFSVSPQRKLMPGILSLAIFLLICGYAHFKYAAFVDTLIPDFIPYHSFWTYSCGIFLLAGGLGLLLPQMRRLAALLSAIMITGWFILLHIPRFFMHPADASDRMGVCESFVFAGIFFCLAGLLDSAKNTTRVVSKTP